MSLPNDDHMLIAYDISEMRPGCALIQVGMSATTGIASHFDTRHWLLAPTPGMSVYPVTPEQLKRLVEMTETAHPLSS